jgi:TetR/AcrR family transcriptional repressor of bet genes
VSAEGSAAPAAARRGRPSTGARERILAAAVEVLKAEGYAGLSTAKVAAQAGESKALIAYHFGSKQGLVAAVAREVGNSITAEIVGGIGSARSVEDVVAGSVAGIWRVMDGDVRIARLYFDLSAVSVVSDDVREVMRELRSRWRTVLVRLLRQAEPSMTAAQARTGAVLVHAAIEGLALERIELGDAADLRRARELLVAAVVEAIAPG